MAFVPDEILQAYGLSNAAVQNIGSGLINRTWQVNTAGCSYVLQQINTAVFHRPDDIAFNVKLLGDYLQQQTPDYFFVRPITSVSGEEIVRSKSGGCFRLYPFVKGSHTVDVVETPEQAYEAAAQFGRFTKELSGFDASQLRTVIPQFHDLSLRYRQFEDAVRNGNQQRVAQSKSLIKTLFDYRHIAGKYEVIKRNPAFKIRVTHHDSKISNVLFDASGKGLCVIDLDTVMPGYFISDVGDMLRTYLSPVTEEEQDMEKIAVRDEFFAAIVDGYCSAMNNELTEAEKEQFVYAGQFLIYMQALRFLADYLNNDSYYGSRYKGHNLVRATNQATLLQRLMEKQEVFEKALS